MQTRYAGGSVAYDFEKFENKRARVKKPTLVVAKPNEKTRARTRTFLAVKVAAVLAILVAVVVTMLYSRAVLTELNQKIDRQKTLLDEAISEQTRLTVALEAKVSLRNVEEYATQKLGMTTMDKSQIIYVDLGEGEKIELTDESPKMTLLDRIKMAIRNVKDDAAQD